MSEICDCIAFKAVSYLVLIKFSKNVMDGLDRSVSYNEMGVLLAINVVVVVIVSLLLFPYLWKD